MKKYELVLTRKNIKETIKNDYVDNNRKLYSLIRLVNSIEENTTICIDGEWGSGKTFLINQFKYLNEISDYDEFEFDESILESLSNIKNNNLIVYYDAWKNDNHIDAFESIIFNILNEFPKYRNRVPNYTVTKDVIEKSLKRFCEKSTFDIINFDDIKSYEDLAKKIVTMEEKKNEFKELMDKILGDKRLILIIDELDRCNPLYSSKILETIKHFYDLKNFTIIVVANNRELSNTIKKQYGNEFDAYSYLNKFYDFVITLDNSKIIQYAQKCLGFSTTEYLPNNIAYEMFKKYDFSFRDCNRYKTLYSMESKYIENDKSAVFDRVEYTIAFEIIIPIVIAFKIKDINAYRNICKGENEDLIKALEYIIEKFDSSENHKNWIGDIVGKNENIDEIKKIISVYNKMREKWIYSEIFNDCIRMSIQ